MILVYPVVSESASRVDLHIEPAPGSAAYLAMALARLILTHGCEDREFLANCVDGYQEYLTILNSFTLDDLVRLCDVPLEQVTRLAEILINHRPTAILLGCLYVWSEIMRIPKKEPEMVFIRTISGSFGFDQSFLKKFIHQFFSYRLKLSLCDFQLKVAFG